MSETTGNRQYRDRLFKFIFGNPDNREWTLSLYNAVNGSNYTDASKITFNTIENAVYMSMKNDVSFLIDNVISFYEQQSTFNPNMPMRFLIYAGMVYERYIETNKSYRRNSSAQQKAPTPKCICFYNGVTKKDDTVILKLSDSFDGESDIEVKVRMLNINYGHNKELLEACKPLKEYSWFVDKVRSNAKMVENLEEALDATLSELPDDSLIKPFLLANRAEVKHMCITEYDEARAFAEQREEGREEGIEIGREEGIEIGIERGRLIAFVDLVKKGFLTVEQAAKEFNMTIQEFENKAAGLTS